ncbi:hypothetical protein [uncultured Photobacterium sp.]|uniref:hypothetical protein n=1 Tax=uncultured Photobacterium sp. TaxID=173973 RepID=UPI002621840A|nr:hypothetical protein [uncultured Photobacterium sp.]
MKKIIFGILGVMLSFQICAAEYVIAVKECFLKRNYVVSPIKTDSINKAKRFSTRDEAELYLKKLSPTLMKKKPRVIEIEN